MNTYKNAVLKHNEEIKQKMKVIINKTKYFVLVQGVLFASSGVYIMVNEQRRKQYNEEIKQKMKVLL